MISRKTLLQKLELLKPALAENELCLVLTYYCFDGRRIIACNDRIAIITPCPSEFEGCVRGTVLSDILKVARHAAVVKLFADGEHAVVKLGKAQVKLPTLPIDDFLDATAHSPYPPPLGQLYASGMRAISLTQNCIRGIERKFLAAVEHCLQSVELNSTVPDKLEPISKIAEGCRSAINVGMIWLSDLQWERICHHFPEEKHRGRATWPQAGLDTPGS